MIPQSPHQPLRASVWFRLCTAFDGPVFSPILKMPFTREAVALRLSKCVIPCELKGRETRPIWVDRYD